MFFNEYVEGNWVGVGVTPVCRVNLKCEVRWKVSRNHSGNSHSDAQDISVQTTISKMQRVMLWND